jgi:hypothetical protein
MNASRHSQSELSLLGRYQMIDFENLNDHQKASLQIKLDGYIEAAVKAGCRPPLRGAHRRRPPPQAGGSQGLLPNHAVCKPSVTLANLY